jgi:hypothetical protein
LFIDECHFPTGADNSDISDIMSIKKAQRLACCL